MGEHRSCSHLLPFNSRLWVSSLWLALPFLEKLNFNHFALVKSSVWNALSSVSEQCLKTCVTPLEAYACSSPRLEQNWLWFVFCLLWAPLLMCRAASNTGVCASLILVAASFWAPAPSTLAYLPAGVFGAAALMPAHNCSTRSASAHHCC